jgi:hypothetical protein
MEQIREIAALQSNGSTTLAPASARSLNVESLRHLGVMLQQMSAAFPHQEVPQETAEIFFVTLEDLAVEYGMKNLEAGLRWFLSRQKFFPHPSEVREVLDEMAKNAKAGKLAEMKRNLPKIGCDACDGSGLVITLDTHGERVAKECECKLAWRRAKKAWEQRQREVKA